MTLQAAPLFRSLKADPHVGPAALAVLLSASKAGLTADSEASLFNEFDAAKATATPEATLLLATAHWHLGELQTALLTLDDLDVSTGVDTGTNATAKALGGWITLSQSAQARARQRGLGGGEVATGVHDDESDDDEDGDLGDAAEAFETSLELEPGNVDVRLPC